jgi:hypothetical protein
MLMDLGDRKRAVRRGYVVGPRVAAVEPSNRAKPYVRSRAQARRTVGRTRYATPSLCITLTQRRRRRVASGSVDFAHEPCL